MSREAHGHESEPIQRQTDLLEIFTNGGRPSSDFAMGLEWELLGVRPRTGEAISFDGPRGVEAVLKDMSRLSGWSPVFNGDRVIGLSREKTAVTLEPGGQLELSTSPHQSLFVLKEEVDRFSAELEAASGEKDIRWICIGIQPVTTLSQISWVPKFRYEIMRRYYENRTGFPLEMMARTASIQANLDYIDESDAREKVRIGSILGPVLAAVFANSAVEEGKLNGLISRRLQIWEDMDADRSGVPAFFVDGSFSFERYAEYALDVPMYFVLRDGKYVDCTKFTFRRFLNREIQGLTPTFLDWEAHLTTLFPDVRLKNHLEFRTVDSQNRERSLAMVAFWAGLLYDADAQRAALDRLQSYSHADIGRASREAALLGLQARMRNEPVLEIAKDLVGISVAGLSRLEKNTDRYSPRFLEPLRELLDRGLSPGEEIREHWNGKVSCFIERSAI